MRPGGAGRIGSRVDGFRAPAGRGRVGEAGQATPRSLERPAGGKWRRIPSRSIPGHLDSPTGRTESAGTVTGDVLNPVHSVGLRRAALGLALATVLSLLAPGWAHAGLGQWTSNGPFPGFCAAGLAIDLQAPATIYATTCQSGSSNDGPFKSTTGGASWAPANAGLEGVVVNSLAPDPGGSPTVYAATSGGVFKSVDGGMSWVAANNGLIDLNVTTLAIAPSSTSRIYASTGTHVFRTTDAGTSWIFASQSLPSGILAIAVAVDPHTPTIVYAAGAFGVFKSTDGGDTWNPSGSGLPSGSSSLVIDPHSPATLYAATGGVFRSVHGGNTWQPTDSPPSDVIALAIDHQDSSTLYAVWTVPAAGQGFVSKTTDAGATWSSLPVMSSTVGAIAIELQTPSRVYVATKEGVFKSVNAGGSWESVDDALAPPFQGHVDAIATHPQDAATVFAVSLGAQSAIFQSTNGATSSWVSRLATPSGQRYRAESPSALAIAGQASNTIYAAYTALFRGSRLVSYTSKSIDGGVTWVPADLGLVGPVTTLAVDPLDVATVYAGTEAGGFRPAPRRRTRPASNTVPLWISRMPFAIAFRDNPQARCTRDTPPYGNIKASLAAIRRRVRSSSIRPTDANFRRSRTSGFTRGHDTDH
jgi:photosystem II stability/assembly factor-like uncharacterized protein